jgi:ribosome modulation factor
MADRIVYLVDKLPKHLDDATVEVVDDTKFSDLVASGFEVISTMPGRTITVAGKKLKATMMVLRPSGENRALAPTQGRAADLAEIDDERHARSLVQRSDEWGNSRAMTPAAAAMHDLTRALQNMNAPGHLGPPGNHNIPGMTIISGEMVAKAYDMGSLAGAAGKTQAECPFDPGSVPYVKWNQGWVAAEKAFRDMAQGPDESGLSEKERSLRAIDRANALAEAEREGKHLAQSLGPNDVVRSPYDTRDPRHAAWLKGFQSGGGVIEKVP